jgi:chromosome segregation ATPase
MTNKKNKINELVSDDEDPTAELEALTIRQDFSTSGKSASAESDLSTHGFDDSGQIAADGANGASISELQSDLQVRSETIERLQFDIEQLRARWVGLETEIKAREELTSNLNSDLKGKDRKLDRKEKLLQKRDRSIKALKAEIRERDEKYRELQGSVDEINVAKEELESGDEINRARKQLAENQGQVAGKDKLIRDLQVQQQRTEKYADELRRQLSDISSNSEETLGERDMLARDLSGAEKTVEDLNSELSAAKTSALEAAVALENAGIAHAEEIRLLRFELGEAEETLAQNENIGEQLASDLVETRSFRDELERMLNVNEEQSSASIGSLRKKVSKLETLVKDYEEKLETKSAAVDCLIAELGKKSHEIDSIGEMEDVIQDIDNRMSERIDDAPYPERERERITRLLIGRIDDQELRFPLFKERLTIGRTEQNDIQLKAQYISRRHAVITTEGDAARVVDWGSKNGVYVNSERVTEHFLKNGDIVTIGIAEFRYEELPKREL